MLNPLEVIKAVNKATEPFLMEGGSSFYLNRHANSNTYRLGSGGFISTAYNSYGNDGEQVNVVKWFANFWLFVEIQFLNPLGTKISLSIFQGNEENPNKPQLFRAEWDDYGDGNTTHPQPHWHFITNKLIENNAKEFAELLDDEKETFESFLDEEFKKILDLSKFHFAMNGDWTNSKSHTHLVNNEGILANWFGGLLAYLKSELEYTYKK